MPVLDFVSRAQPVRPRANLIIVIRHFLKSNNKTNRPLKPAKGQASFDDKKANQMLFPDRLRIGAISQCPTSLRDNFIWENIRY